jgi:hypothetical protein
MIVRTTTRTVTFARPFMLKGIDEEQPAGSYTVETDEELLEGASVPAYRRIATLIRLPGRPGSTVLGYVVDIDSAELTAALEKDAGACSGFSQREAGTMALRDQPSTNRG